MHDYHSSNLSLIPFDYAGKSIRVILDDQGNPWWVAVDVCRELGFKNARDALTKLDDDEKSQAIDPTSVGNSYANGFNHLLNLVNESGLYHLIFTSYKPAAKAFRRFVTDHVLPELNRKGYYVSPSAQHRFAFQGNDSSPMETLHQLDTETIRSFSKLIDLHDAIYQQGRDAAISGATCALRQVSGLDLKPILSAFRENEHSAFLDSYQDGTYTDGLQRRHTAPLRNLLDVSIGCPPPRPQNAAERKETPLRDASMHSGQNEGEEKTTSPADTHVETDHSADAQPHAVIMTKAKDSSKSEPQDTASLKKTIKTAKPGEDQRSQHRIEQIRNTRKLQAMIDISSHYHDLIQRRKAGEPFPGGRTSERTASTFAVGVQTVKRANRLVRAITRIERINPRARDTILAGQLNDAIMNLSPAVEAMNHSELSTFAAAIAAGTITNISTYQRTMADIPAAIAETEINTHPSSTSPMADSAPPKQTRRKRSTKP